MPPTPEAGWAKPEELILVHGRNTECIRRRPSIARQSRGLPYAVSRYRRSIRADHSLRSCLNFDRSKPNGPPRGAIGKRDLIGLLYLCNYGQIGCQRDPSSRSCRSNSEQRNGLKRRGLGGCIPLSGLALRADADIALPSRRVYDLFKPFRLWNLGFLEKISEGL